jgi:hypothetical protein
MTTMEELRAEMEARLEYANPVRIDPEALRSGADKRGFGATMLERIRDRLGLNGWAAATNF